MHLSNSEINIQLPNDPKQSLNYHNTSCEEGDGKGSIQIMLLRSYITKSMITKRHDVIIIQYTII